jgi:hypothetical protein
MADDERPGSDETDSSLELPSLRSAFRRRRRPPPEREPEVPDTAIPPVAITQEPTSEPTSEPADRPKRRRPRGPIRIHLPGRLVAPLTGAIAGLALVGLTSAGLHLCSAMRGTSSCGKPGIVLLLVITVAVILLGSLLLRLADVDTHGSTSFLGVGLLGVLLMLALTPALHAWWIVMAVPLLAMATFLAAWWLTTTYSEPGGRRG